MLFEYEDAQRMRDRGIIFRFRENEDLEVIFPDNILGQLLDEFREMTNMCPIPIEHKTAWMFCEALIAADRPDPYFDKTELPKQMTVVLSSNPSVICTFETSDGLRLSYGFHTRDRAIAKLKRRNEEKLAQLRQLEQDRQILTE